MREPEGTKSSTGLDTRTAALLTYVLGFITGIIFLTIEKDSRFVKFHAMQSILISVALLVINLVLGFIPVIGWIVGILLVPLSFILWIACMLLALQGKLFKLPVVGDIAERQSRLM
jgi:uncharacterized membrane protein